ncbi:hypothetical protein SPRG_08979 [Saprolegnia parasitica CBS 223.65]|uniref:F-box domain-containing protein n=1 Tax=Saprolegnia parasitica (strain CBS 223.65) TaxID=695850 RepID=A0A067C979_SAPPC|nr:hypothetical protein SPRG_08979 [Saprolegnia parasitica CBS 223.65]KDO25680.1 hypothetical protein SPRG_08979 [Saprolegnia parasitica CBS 223.65]|eukprot:XP_012203710.1 hypothetical protein SPRG_08979 [Saprolegnia parasitica CBS 223.65]
MAQRVLAESPELLAAVARFVASADDLSALLRLTARAHLPAPLQSLVLLAQTVPMASLWPSVRCAALVTPAEVALATTVVGFFGHLRLDVQPSDAQRCLVDVSEAVAVDYEVAASEEALWQGDRISTLTLRLATGSTPAHVNTVARWIATAPRLVCVCLSFEHWTDMASLLVLAESINANPRIRTIALRGCSLTAVPDAMVMSLARWVHRGYMTGFSLGNIQPRVPFLASSIGGALRSLKQLRTLNLENESAIAAAYFGHPTPLPLRRLSLRSKAGFQSWGITTSLLNGHVALPDLHTLEVGYACLEPAMLSALATAVLRLPVLGELVLTCTGARDPNLAEALVRVLPRCKRLRRLALRNVLFDDARWWHVAVACPSLRYLCLRHAQLANDVAASWRLCCPRVRICCATAACDVRRCEIPDVLPTTGAMDPIGVAL